jgi:chitinase
MSNRLRWSVLAALMVVLSVAAVSPALAANCTGVAAYSPSTIYNAGNTTVYKTHLWQALIQIWNTPPDYCATCGWWQDLGACDGGGDTTAPSVPTGLNSPSQTTTSIALGWTASTDNVGVTGYLVFRGTTQVGTPSGTSFTDSGLTPNTTYSYTVKAKDAAGNTSAASTALSVKTKTSVTCTTIPSVPSGLSSPSQTNSSINLQWTASTAGAGCTISYRISVNGSLNKTSTTNSTTITGLAANTTYSLTVAATDEAGTSSQSTALSVKTKQNPPPSSHLITGYWQNFNNGARVVKLRDVPSGYNLIAVAFADATGTPGAVTFNLDGSLGYSGLQEFKNDITALHGQGRKVIISVGGQNGTISVTNSTAATNFQNSILNLMTSLGVDGVDIDLENGVNATFMGQALRGIANARPGAVITMAPQTIDMQSPGTEYFKLALNIKDILTVVNMQYYNSGTMLGCDGQVYAQGTVNFLTALACIQLQNGLRPDQVGLGLPASPAAAGGGYVSPSVVNNALDCLASGTNCGSFRPPRTWPGIRGAMTWSINHDGTNNYPWVTSVAGHIGQVP